MLRKLLKYDIKFIKKGWIAGAILSFLLSILGGFCASMIEESSGTDYEGFFIVAVVLYSLVIFGMICIPYVVSLYRFYQNFYTDEGYLTFTLPVKKHDLILSKLLFTLLSLGSSLIVVGIDLLTFFATSSLFMKNMSEESATEFDPGVFSIVLLALLIAAVAVVAVTIFIFVMVSFASKFSQKGRVIFGVATIYGMGFLFSIATAFIVIMVGENPVIWADIIPAASATLVVTLLLLCILVFLAALSVALYLLEYYLLDKHLNLY